MIGKTPPCEDNKNNGASTNDAVTLKLIQHTEVEDKFGREVCFQLWLGSADTGIFENPKTWSLTCRINGEGAPFETWNNYDSAIFDTLDAAVSALHEHVEIEGGSANE